MKGLRNVLGKIPTGLFTVLTVLTILWLTLAPKPLGENPPPLFPGADKIAHGIMFGGLTTMILIDLQRKYGWKSVKPLYAMIAALISASFGTLIEFLQDSMGMGRGFEYGDIVADTAGAFLFGFMWLIFQKFWVLKPQK